MVDDSSHMMLSFSLLATSDAASHASGELRRQLDCLHRRRGIRMQQQGPPPQREATTAGSMPEKQPTSDVRI
jgi:hypothetical protein